VDFVVHTLRDITERKTYENKLERANKELEGFADTVSHDLRGPLTTMAMAHTLVGDLLEKKAPELIEEVSDLMRICEVSLKRSTGLIDDLLVMARTGEPTDAYSIDLNEKVKEILFERKPELVRKGIEVKVGDLGELTANPTHVYQVFNNLIRNAMRYAAPDNPLIEVKRLEEHRFLVRDNGPGISAEIIEDIFLPFVKGREGDTGLGLSIVEKIVTACGGEISAYNDNGACFEFTMPDCPRSD
jgi:signal transduction histidine kinase